jgi:hypothetical protein
MAVDEHYEEFRMCPRGGGGWAVTEAALARKISAVARRAEFLRIWVDGSKLVLRFAFVAGGGFVEIPSPQPVGGQPHGVDADWVRELESRGWVATWHDGNEMWVGHEFYFAWKGFADESHRRATALACAAMRDLHGVTEDDWWRVEVYWPFYCAYSALCDAQTWREIEVQRLRLAQRVTDEPTLR